MRSQSLQVWRTKCLYLTQFGVSSRIFPTSTSPAAQHGPSGRARARGAINTIQSVTGVKNFSCSNNLRLTFSVLC